MTITAPPAETQPTPPAKRTGRAASDVAGLGVLRGGAFVLPAMVTVGIFLLFPALWTIYIGITNYRLTGEQARDISVFSSFPQDQEAVMPPRSTTRQVRDPELAERVRADVLAVAEDMVRRNVIPAVPERFEVVVIEEDPRGR